MRVLLDENLPHKLRTAIHCHQVETTRYRRWSGLKNGKLLDAAESGGTDVLVTGDKGISYQQSLKGRSIALVVLSATNWPIVKKHLPAIQEAVDKATPGTFHLVNWGAFSRSRGLRSDKAD